MGKGQPLRVRDLMTEKPVTMSPDDSLQLTDDVMRLGRIRHIPVVEGGRLVGLLTHRDLLAASVSSLVGLTRREDTAFKDSILVRQAMRRDVAVVSPDETALHACRLMLEKKIGCLPVVEGDGALAGILTESDFLTLTLRLLTGESADQVRRG